MPKSPRSASSSFHELLELLPEERRHYLAAPWDFVLEDPERRWKPVLGAEVLAKAANRPVLALTDLQKAALKDFVDVTKPRFIWATGRGCSKTMISALGQAVLAWCLPVFTCTVNAGSLKQALENYRYLKAFAEAPAMRPPLGPIVQDPTSTTVRLANGGWISILAASERQAKGPHPMMVILDEACAADPDIVLLVEGQLSGAPAPHGGAAALYRIQSTPDKLFHLFRDRWDRRQELGYAWHQWGARDCPWITKEEIAQSRLEHDANWCRIYLDGEFGSASGTVFRYEDLQAATIATLQEDPLWAFIEKDLDRIGKRSLGTDWGFEHPTVWIVVVQVERTEELARQFPKVKWPAVYVVHVEGHSHVAAEELYEGIAATAVTWRAAVHLDAGGNPWGDAAIRRALSHVGLRSESVSFAKYNLEMVGAVRALLEQGRVRIPLTGEGALLLRQLADYSWDPDVEKEKPLKVADDYVDALKLAVWGLRGGKPGPVLIRRNRPFNL